MASDPQARAAAGNSEMGTLCRCQDGLETKVRKRAANMHQMLQRMQNLPSPALAPPSAAGALLPRTPGCLPQRFAGDSEKMRTFLAQYELFIGTRSVNLLKASAIRWALPMIECNDPIKDNYQNFLAHFRQHFGDAIQEDTAMCTIQELQQGN
ncbi:hypothetical protein E2320_022751 [Naja naja]|nr:hypothetical protein E2320_022751 [Naja naja]